MTHLTGKNPHSRYNQWATLPGRWKPVTWQDTVSLTNLIGYGRFGVARFVSLITPYHGGLSALGVVTKEPHRMPLRAKTRSPEAVNQIV
jgi:hypothetical protein